MTLYPSVFLTSLHGLLDSREIGLGNFVLTHKKRYRQVISIIDDETPSRLLTIYGNSPAIISDNSFILSRRRKRYKGKLKWTEPIWTPVRHLTRYDFICYPVDEPGRQIVSSKDAGAYYLAGHLYASNAQDTMIIKKEIKKDILGEIIKNIELEEILDLNILRIKCKTLSDLIEVISKGNIHSVPLEAQMAFWSGWLAQSSSVDFKTALTVARIGRSVVKQGVHLFNWSDQDNLLYSVSGLHKSDLKRQIYEFGCVWARVKKNVRFGNFLFKTIDVEEDHSFIQNGFVCSFNPKRL